MAVNKVVQSNGTTLIDISDTTAVASDVASGKYFYLATGEKVAGSASGGGSASTIPLTASGVFTLSANAQTMQIPHGLGQVPTMACFYPADNVTNSTGTNITIGGTFGKVKTDGSNVFPPSVSVSSGWSADRIPNRAGLYCSPDGNTLDDAQMVWQYDDDDWGIVDVDATYIYIKAGYSSNPLLWTGTRYKWWAIAPTDTGGSGGGGSATLITKNITANGTYSASDDSADGYSSVTVNVSGGGSAMNVQTAQSTDRRNNTALGSVTSLTCEVAGTYDVYWTCARSNTSQTWGSQLYINGTAYGTENTTWNNNVQVNHLEDVVIPANATVAVYGRSRSGYYIYVPQLTIQQTA